MLWWLEQAWLRSQKAMARICQWVKANQGVWSPEEKGFIKGLGLESRTKYQILMTLEIFKPRHRIRFLVPLVLLPLHGIKKHGSIHSHCWDGLRKCSFCTLPLYLLSMDHSRNVMLAINFMRPVRFLWSMMMHMNWIVAMMNCTEVFNLR